MPRFLSSLSSVLFVALLPFLVRCGGDSASTATDADAGGDASATSDGGTSPGADSGTSMGTDGGGTPGTDPAWATAPLKSAGCGMAATPSGANGDKKTVMVGGVARTFVLYVPKGYDPNKNYPIVFSYHGIDATGADMAQFLQFQTYSNGGAIAVFPDGAQMGAHIGWDTSGDKDLLFFDAMVKSLTDTLCVNQRRIFVLGFSLGAYMVNHLGCKRSGVIRAFIPADGGFPDAAATCGKTTVLVYHRTEDDNESVTNGRKARDKWLGIDGCQSSSKPLNDFGFNDTTAGDLGCLQYDGCPANTTVSYCEDMYVSPQLYKHDLRQPYRVPMWNWFNHF
jgi:polyhydroxybutyrate depolymerase